MKTIILVSCSSKKATLKCEAEEMYTSTLFKSSLSYAKKLQPDVIYVLSAKYGLLSLNEVIKPYNVTLAIAPIANRKEGLVVLDGTSKKAWGVNVIKQLSAVADLQKDQFIFLAGKAYVKPLKDHLQFVEEPLMGMRQGERMSFLKSKLI
jgi:hypothetical protein